MTADEPKGEIQTLLVASAAVADGTRGRRAKWWLVAWLGALAISVGASLLWSLTDSSATPESVGNTGGLSQVPPEETQPPVSSRAVGATTDLGRSIVVVLPAEHDYLSSRTIPVAGLAFGRPHGPQVRTVHAELIVNGRVVGRADLPVYSGRFAGSLEIVADLEAGGAELHVADPTRPGTPAAVRQLTVNASD